MRLLRRVRLHVRAQVRFVRKRFRALAAFEWLFSRVRADVSLEQPRAREPLAAVRTRATLGVCTHVHAEGWHADVHLLAVRTLARFLVVRVAMNLTVTCKVARCAVLLAARDACVNVTSAEVLEDAFNEFVELVEVDIPRTILMLSVLSGAEVVTTAL